MEVYSQVEAAKLAMVSTGTLNTAIRRSLIPEPTIQVRGGRRKYYDEVTTEIVVNYFRTKRQSQIETLKSMIERGNK